MKDETPHILASPEMMKVVTQISKKARIVFYTLLPLIDLENNVVVSVDEAKEWDKPLKDLCDEGILENLGDGMYFVNPILAKHPKFKYDCE